MSRTTLMVGRAISFSFGFLAGTTREWWLLWFSILSYIILAAVTHYVFKTYKIGILDDQK